MLCKKDTLTKRFKQIQIIQNKSFVEFKREREREDRLCDTVVKQKIILP